MRRITIFAATAVASVAVSGLLLGGRAGAAPEAPMRVGVVDIFKVMENAPKKRVIEQQRAERKTAIEKFQQEQSETLQKMRGQVMALPRFAPDRDQKEEELAREAAMLKFQV